MTDNNSHRYLSYVIKGSKVYLNQVDKDNYIKFMVAFIPIIPHKDYQTSLSQYLESNPLTYAILGDKKSFLEWFLKFQSPNPYLNLYEDMYYENVSPKEWGSLTWNLFADVITHYDHIHKHNYKIFFECQQFVLPCGDCRHNYSIDLQSYPLTDQIVNRKDSLMNWLNTIKSETNRKIKGETMPSHRLPPLKSPISTPVQQKSVAPSPKPLSRIRAPPPPLSAKIPRRPPLPTSYQPPQRPQKKECSRCGNKNK